ncbi:FMRFamide-activated amiloride-sensitive sodium like protein [Argiope bruennichi]|uniref:FMRFamide-activated amiloride-sensitive sodium like protein n=1 Tax=Argiope bruennichi TaxID=94029 RepID=A0A8T0ECS3_ARGBR|nr:FMRFamide-activated amiloride-sensitive sodium like protein [Argiope bruennichi]
MKSLRSKIAPPNSLTFLARSLYICMEGLCYSFSILLKNSSVYVCTRVVQSLFKRAWFLVLVISLIVSSYKIWKFCQLYWQYPIVVSLQINETKTLKFPAVTMCNLNRQMGEFNVKEDTDPITGEPLLISERRNLYYCQNGTIKNDKTNQEKIDYLMAYYAMDEKERHIFGMNPLMFMESCTFNGKFCSLAQLNFFTDFRYGNCITFNKKKQYMETLRTSEIGPGSGLNVYLNLYKFYYQNIQHTLGIKLIIHDPTEVPSTEDDGVFVGPGFEVLASLKQTINIRLPKPYQDHCVIYDSETKGFAKNKKECIRACIQAKSYETCGCDRPVFGSDEPPEAV